MCLTIIGLALILIFPASSLPWRFGLWPLLILAVINQELVKRKAYRDERRIDAAGQADVNPAPGHGPGVRVNAVAEALRRVLGFRFWVSVAQAFQPVQTCACVCGSMQANNFPQGSVYAPAPLKKDGLKEFKIPHLKRGIRVERKEFMANAISQPHRVTI